ncbi:MAG TPA: hypothetical protein VFB22_01520 [Candidatus Baltobacteraceae bacterium]|nr:hypothetical protein [Candidatus Baltobacteraceae bacterium]
MLGAWNSFYVMMGTSAAALTGLVFIVITLVNEQRRSTSEAGLTVFTTPTVVHFSAALLTCAVMTMPFPSLTPVEIVLGLTGLAGLAYVLGVARRASALSTYRPDAEDWAWNVALPAITYAALVFAAFAMHATLRGALFAPGVVVLLLAFIGIHNAWDVVTFLATGKADALPDDPPSGAAES